MPCARAAGPGSVPKVAYRILSDTEVVRHIRGGASRYAIWLGAGVSVDSGIQTASEICRAIRQDLLKARGSDASQDAAAVTEWENGTLDWNDPQRRYTTCIRRAYPNPATRLTYFRGLLRKSRPGFSHYATALLMSEHILDHTSFTTNFDHLLEHAFGELNLIDYQSIRSRTETGFWEPSDERCFILKLHGDIDTDNILNTTAETLEISPNMRRTVFGSLRKKGLIVLGSAGNEKSIWKLFDDIEKKTKPNSSLLSYGLLWGVYMGQKKPKALSESDLAARVQSRIKETDINRNIIDVMERSQNELFAFFPVWGAGSFLLDVVAATGSPRIVGTATRYLDHEMRLHHIFTKAGLAEKTVDKHLATLRDQRRNISQGAKSAVETYEEVWKGVHASGRLTVRVAYGDITSRGLMGSPEFASQRRAVVSPEDTYITAGGGVSFGLLKKAGELLILNELTKLAPIKHCSVAVTSGGYLPVHYIIHAAALHIGEGPSYVVSKGDVTATAEAVLDKVRALEVGVVWIPLMGAGVAPLSPGESLTALLEAVRAFPHNASQTAAELTIVIMIYQERLLPRHDVALVAKQVLGSDFSVQPV
jgi:O-acetyl-ADP-ribose deacetylase (regulator of RNase III)